MAIYHLHAKIWSRGKGKGAGGHARYILRQGPYAEKQVEVVDGATVRIQKVSRAEEVVYSASAHMPEWAQDDVSAYWDAADQFERTNGTVYREIEFALPEELNTEQNVTLAIGFAEFLAEVDRGKTPYTLAVHRSDNDSRLLHCHLMLSDRVNDGCTRDSTLWFRRAANVTPSKKTGVVKDPALGGAPKTRMRISREWLKDYVRPLWGRLANEALEGAGHNVRIDHRTLEAQRMEQEALAAQAMKKGHAKAAMQHTRNAEALDRPPAPKKGRVLTHRGEKVAPGRAAMVVDYEKARVDRAQAVAARRLADAAAEQDRWLLVRAQEVWEAAWRRQWRDDEDRMAIQDRWDDRRRIRRAREARLEAEREAACLALEQQIVASFIAYKNDPQKEPPEEIDNRWQAELDVVLALGVSDAALEAVGDRARQRAISALEEMAAEKRAMKQARRAAKCREARAALDASHLDPGQIPVMHRLQSLVQVSAALVHGCRSGLAAHRAHRQIVQLRWNARRDRRISRLREQLRQKRVALENGQVDPLAPMARARFFAGFHGYYAGSREEGRLPYQAELQADLDALNRLYSATERAARQAADQARRAAKRQVARRELQDSRSRLSGLSPWQQWAITGRVVGVVIHGYQIHRQAIQAHWTARRDGRMTQLREQIQELCADLRSGVVNVQYTGAQEDLLDELPWYYDADSQQWRLPYQTALQADLDAFDAQYQALERQVQQEDEDRSVIVHLQYNLTNLLQKGAAEDSAGYASTLQGLGCLQDGSGRWVHTRQNTPLGPELDALLVTVEQLAVRQDRLHTLMQAAYPLVDREQRHAQGLASESNESLPDKWAYEDARRDARRAGIAEAVLTEAWDRVVMQVQNKIHQEIQAEREQQIREAIQGMTALVQDIRRAGGWQEARHRPAFVAAMKVWESGGSAVRHPLEMPREAKAAMEEVVAAIAGARSPSVAQSASSWRPRGP